MGWHSAEEFFNDDLRHPDAPARVAEAKAEGDAYRAKSAGYTTRSTEVRRWSPAEDADADRYWNSGGGFEHDGPPTSEEWAGGVGWDPVPQ